VELYTIVSDGIHADSQDIISFSNDANITCEQFATVFQLSDPSLNDNKFVREKILWTELMSYKLALDKLIGNASFELDDIVNARFKHFAQLCHVLACVVEIHLTSWTIQQDATSEECVGVNHNDIGGHCKYGLCPYDAILVRWHDSLANEICTDVEAFISVRVMPLIRHNVIACVPHVDDGNNVIAGVSDNKIKFALCFRCCQVKQPVAILQKDTTCHFACFNFVRRDVLPRRLQHRANIHSDICHTFDDVRRDDLSRDQRPNAKRDSDVAPRDEQPHRQKSGAEIRDPNFSFIA